MVDIATAIAFVGWLVTGIGWYVTQRAQKRMFVFQALNAARAELVTALRAEQGTLGDLVGLILQLEIDHKYGLTANWPHEKWFEWFPRYQKLLSQSDGVQWIFLLEQYEVLFPETAECRKQLVGRLKFNSQLPSFFLQILEPRTREQALEQCESLRDQLSDQQALIEDLLVHIQNATLGTVVGRRLPFRQPPDPKVPRIVMGKRKQLEIVDGTGAIPSKPSLPINPDGAR